MRMIASAVVALLVSLAPAQAQQITAKYSGSSTLKGSSGKDTFKV